MPHIDMAKIVRKSVALKGWNERNRWIEVLECEKTPDSSKLMVTNGKTSTRKHKRFAHPILNSTPVQTTNLRTIATNARKILLGSG